MLKISLKKVIKSHQPLLIILILAFFFRLLVTPYFTYLLDFHTYLAWSNHLFNHGFKTFFTDTNWVDYLPGYPYILYALATIKNILHLTNQQFIFTLYKLPAIFADIGTGLIIYKLLALRTKPYARLLAVAAYLFNPAIFSNSALWGQTDSFTALFALLSFYFALKHKSFASGLCLGLGALIKLNTMLLIPLLGLIFIRSKKYSQFFITTATCLAVFTLGFIPFSNTSSLSHFILNRISIVTNQYQHTSLNAFNLWFLFEGSWKSDQVKYLFFTKHLWGTFIFLIVNGFNLFKLLIKKKPKIIDYSHAGFIIFSSAFLFLTRMHERHLLAVFPFLLLLSVLKTKYQKYYLYFSLSYLINLLFGFQSGPGNQALIYIPTFLAKLLSFTNLIVFVSMFKPKISCSNKLFFLILIFSLCLRLFRLSIPQNYHFDEVYHAFTARQMLTGNIKAWQWWNTPPPGVAYEWTHPPMAKHFMVLSMSFLGQNSFAWRLPSVIFGVFNIYLVYLLAKKLFSSSKHLPILAASLYSLETLTLVQSRIAMNDTCMITFILISLLSLLNQKYPASSLSFGLALATKWSAIYLAPVLLLARTVLVKQGLSFKNLLLFAIRYMLYAICVYLLAYLPFFIYGHSWNQFLELQKQMYWYHTNLKATHSYSSPWWSWPLMLRPVWYYVNYGKNTIANIYALGNIFIFYPGLAAIFYSSYYLVKNFSKKFIIHHSSFIILLSGYLAFLLPWALAPRIMFVYHYLPSIPFMVILLAWTLTRFKALQKSLIILFVICNLLFVIWFFPYLTAIPVPSVWIKYFHWFPGWR